MIFISFVFSYHQKYLLQRYPYILTILDIEPGKPLVQSYVAARLNGYVGGYGSLKDFEAESKKLGLPPKAESYVINMLSKNKKAKVAC
jgi:peptide-methionine (S)-S-oxide reductase